MDNKQPIAAKEHSAFFRQSGWLMIANVAGGAMSWAVHFLNRYVPNGDYGNFGALLGMTSLLPTIPLQMILAQQTVAALAGNRERQLSGVIRLACFWTTLVWLIGAGLVFAFQDHIVHRWQLPNATELWVAMFTVLFAIITPIFSGVLQGRQNFFWMGWLAMLGGIFRIAIAAGLVIAFHLGAAGMMTGALVGIGFGVIASAWITRDLWMLRSEKFDGEELLRKIVPLTLGFGAWQFMFLSDTLYAKTFFSTEEIDPYVAAGTLSRALLWLVLPLAAVMFPKLVHSTIKAEKTNLLGIVLTGTAILATCCGLGLWLLGPFVVRIIYKNGWAESAIHLLPWYAAAMIPLSLTNVVANDLLARGRYRAVPGMVLIALIYAFALPYILTHYSHKLETILQTLAVFNLLMFLLCGWFAWRDKRVNTANVAG
jgi:O-antigen/teichoic acid export membrane protein